MAVRKIVTSPGSSTSFLGSVCPNRREVLYRKNGAMYFLVIKWSKMKIRLTPAATTASDGYDQSLFELCLISTQVIPVFTVVWRHKAIVIHNVWHGRERASRPAAEDISDIFVVAGRPGGPEPVYLSHFAYQAVVSRNGDLRGCLHRLERLLCILCSPPQIARFFHFRTHD